MVMAALRSNEAKCFRLAPRTDVLPDWPRRGIVDEMGGNSGKFEATPNRPLMHSNTHFYSDAAESLIRTSPEHDRTNGFFVACIVRIGSEQSVLGKRKPGGKERDGDATGEITSNYRRKKKKRRKSASTSGVL